VKIIILTFFFILFSFVASALELNTLKAFPLDNPLSYQYIKSITQDSDDFIWFGSHDGLHRYDGYNFLSFHHSNSEPTSLSSDIISDLLIDHLNNLWIGTRGGGLNLYRKNSQDFFHISTQSNGIKLVNDNVNVLIEDSNGKIWVGTEKGLNILTPMNGSWKIETITHNAENPNSLAHNTIETLLQTNDNEIWVGTNGGGISVFDLKGDFVRQQNFAKNTQFNDTNKLIKVLNQDSQGNIWIGTTDNGLLKFDISSQITHYNADKKDNLFIPSNAIEAIYQDSNNQLWVATDKGLLIYNTRSNRFELSQHSDSNPYSLSNNFVLTFFEDNNNLMWIGTFSGVNRWDPNTTTFAQYNSAQHPELINSLVMSFTQLNQDKLLFSTYNGGIFQLSVTSKEITKLPFNDTFKNIRITKLFYDNNILWVGSRFSGLFKINLPTQKINHFLHNKLGSISANSITDIIKDKNNNLWVSTYHQGINRLNEDGSFTAFTKTNSQKTNTQPSTNHILQMLSDDQGYIWLATYGGGINRFDPNTNTFIHINHKNKKPKSLSSDLAWVVFQDKNKNLWVGTQSSGIDMLSAENLKSENFEFDHLNINSGMIDQTIYGIKQDPKGNIWYSSNRGISRYSPKNKNFKHFGSSHGLLALEYNYGAIFKMTNNQLYFGSVKGFTSINLNENMQEQAAPKVRLTNIFKLNEAMDFKKNLNKLKSLTLDHNDQLISFEYVGLNYSAPESTRYKYRLLGFDKQWVEAGKLRRATYTNLPAGKYQLEIIAGNNDNVWSDPGLTLSIIVKPAPWFTWWAYLLYTLLFALLLLAYSRFLNRKLVIEQQQKNSLKQQVQEKTQEFQQKNIELQQANKQLENAATTDQLTNVKSRRYLDIYIEQASQLMTQIHQNLLPVQRHLLPRLYMLMVKINDIEQVGDCEIIDIKDLLLYSRNKDDLVIRWSKDIFAMIGYEKEDNARELCLRLSKRFQDSFTNSIDIAYSFYPFNREQPMDLSWDQVSVLTEQSLHLIQHTTEINWLGLYEPKTQPFNYLNFLKINTVDELNELVKIKQG